MNKDINPKNNNNQAHGYWERYHHFSNKLWYKCFYNNGREIGYEEWHKSYDNKLVKVFYII